MPIDDTWVNNSLASEVPSDEGFIFFVYFLVALSILILVHSFFINYNAKKIRSIRVISDIAALCTLVQGLCFIGCSNGCSPRSSAYALGLFVNGILTALAQVCDNYIVFERYCYVYNAFGREQKHWVSTPHKVLVFIYVVVFLYFTWLPFFTIFPWFFDCNSDEAVAWLLFNIAYICSFTYVAYDLVYTGLMIRMVISVSRSQEKQERKDFLRILAIKSVIHNMFSMAAILAYGYYLVYGVLIYNLFVMVSIHFLFNCKIEKVIKPDLWWKSKISKYSIKSSQVAVGDEKAHEFSLIRVNPRKPPANGIKSLNVVEIISNVSPQHRSLVNKKVEVFQVNLSADCTHSSSINSPTTWAVIGIPIDLVDQQRLLSLTVPNLVSVESNPTQIASDSKTSRNLRYAQICFCCF
eukprot:gene2834-5569_t